MNSLTINYGAAQEKEFTCLNDALWFASNLDGGFHCWVGDSLFIDCVKSFFTGKYETEIF